MAIAGVIKYNGSPDVFAWKYPNEELGTWSQIIVNESQEAVLFKGGQALDLFPAGRYALSTGNIPLLRSLINLPFGGNSPFTAEVWYVNKVHSLDVKWGTPSPIQLRDPEYGVMISVRAFGQFGIQISDSRKFLMKLVGTLSSFGKSDLQTYFRGLYLMKVKDAIASYLVNRKICVLEINAYLNELSKYLKGRMEHEFSSYGIGLINFYVNDISVPEDDPAAKTLKDALAKRAEMQIIGYNYVQERSFDTLEGAATNPGGGQSGLMGAGIGLGMGVGMGGAFGQQMGGLTQNINISETKKCPKCGADVDKNVRFCGRCGADTFEAERQSAAHARDFVKCSKCGAEFSKTSKFCPSCGDPYRPCGHCGADLPEGAAACPECGKAVPQPCPKCGALVKTPGVKFCPECGTPFFSTCPKCGARIEGGYRFCPECGAKIDGGAGND